MILRQTAKIFLTLVLLAGAVFLICPAPAKADLMTYYYTGNPFTQLSEYATDLMPNLTG